MKERFQSFAIRFAVVVGGAYWVLKTYAPKNLYILFYVIPAYLIYFLPQTIAEVRDHHNRRSISVLNLFLGWTFVGWVIALAWSLTKVPPQSKSSV